MCVCVNCNCFESMLTVIVVVLVVLLCSSGIGGAENRINKATYHSKLSV